MADWGFGFAFDMELETPLDFFDVTYKNGEKVRYEKRPHGEWIHAEEYDYLDENGVEHFHIKCPNCNFLHDCFDCHTAQYNFCPNCGASMRKEGDSK